jgi:hypothetical protein
MGAVLAKILHSLDAFIAPNKGHLLCFRPIFGLPNLNLASFLNHATKTLMDHFSLRLPIGLQIPKSYSPSHQDMSQTAQQTWELLSRDHFLKKQVSRITSADLKLTDSNDQTCLFCMDPLQNHDRAIKLPCGHMFGYRHLMEWLNFSDELHRFHNRRPHCQRQLHQTTYNVPRPIPLPQTFPYRVQRFLWRQAVLHPGFVQLLGDIIVGLSAWWLVSFSLRTLANSCMRSNHKLWPFEVPLQGFAIALYVIMRNILIRLELRVTLVRVLILLHLLVSCHDLTNRTILFYFTAWGNGQLFLSKDLAMDTWVLFALSSKTITALGAYDEVETRLLEFLRLTGSLDYLDC